MQPHFTPTAGPQPPSDFLHLPDRLILDISDAIQTFQADIASCEEYENCIEEIAAELLIYINSTACAEAGLRALDIDMRRIYQEDGHVIAPAAVKLGRSLLAQLRLSGLYTSDGYLHYQFTDWFDGLTPVLIKTTHQVKKLTTPPYMCHVRVVQPSGSFEEDYLTKDQVQRSVFRAYHQRHNAVLVDGKCVYTGQVSRALIRQMEQDASESRRDSYH